MSISPALLLAMVLAATSASLYELASRASWLLFPVCWALGVASFVAGQALGAIWGHSFLMIGQLHAGPGLIINGVALLALRQGRIWYTSRH